MKTNIENVVVFRDRGTYGYTVRYKSGKHKTVVTGGRLVVANNVHNVMKNAIKTIAHDDSSLDYHEVIYYA